MPNNSKELAFQIAQILDSKKAEDVRILDISRLTIIADYFVIASGRSELQVKTLCDELDRKLSEQGLAASRRDGYRNARWVVLDYSDVIVHIFHREERAFYNLERLWADSLQLSIHRPG